MLWPAWPPLSPGACQNRPRLHLPTEAAQGQGPCPVHPHPRHPAQRLASSPEGLKRTDPQAASDDRRCGSHDLVGTTTREAAILNWGRRVPTLPGKSLFQVLVFPECPCQLKTRGAHRGADLRSWARTAGLPRSEGNVIEPSTGTRTLLNGFQENCSVLARLHMGCRDTVLQDAIRLRLPGRTWRDTPALSATHQPQHGDVRGHATSALRNSKRLKEGVTVHLFSSDIGIGRQKSGETTPGPANNKWQNQTP